MAKTTTINKATTTTPTVSTPTKDVLTVVIVNEKGQPVSGTTVSIQPTNESGVTNSAGEVYFKLGSATKYDIKVSSGSNTVTVPYYVTKDGATRLIVNPVYVKTIEKQLQHSSLLGGGVILNGSIFIGVAIVFIVLWKMFKRR